MPPPCMEAICAPNAFFLIFLFLDFHFSEKSQNSGFAVFRFPMHCGIQTPDQRNAKVIPKSRCELLRCDLDSGR